jgi:hypothetical protein
MSQERLGSAVRYLEMLVEAGEELRDWLANACEIFDGPVPSDQFRGQHARSRAFRSAAGWGEFGGKSSERYNRPLLILFKQPAHDPPQKRIASNQALHQAAPLQRQDKRRIFALSERALNINPFVAC